jgi:hypothetical protein
MDWKDVGKLIAPLAPVAGSIVGGLLPIPGGSLIGEKFGQLIAGAFGVAPTPQAVSEAIAVAGEETARAKIQAATEQARIEIEGFVAVELAHLRAIEAGLHETATTMRAEVAQRHWYYTGWRPAIGWVFVLAALAFGAMLTVAASGAAFAGKERPLQILTDAWPIWLAYFGVLGLMVGVYIPSRSMEKRAGAVAAPTTAAQPAPKPAVGVKPVTSAKPPPAYAAPTVFRPDPVS